MKTRDVDIRNVLHRELRYEYAYDTSTRIIDELGICNGEARVDIAVVNGLMHGFEIKSDKDTLDRLPGQIEVYCKVFDTVTIVTGYEHLENIINMVPEWWGIDLAKFVEQEVVEIEQIRSTKENYSFDAFSLTQFLWREELLTLLDKYEVNKKIKGLPRFRLWNYVAENIELQVLKDYVRECIKKRTDWRVD